MSRPVWEYTVLPVPPEAEQRQFEFDTLGVHAWELVSVYMGHAYFKREVVLGRRS